MLCSPKLLYMVLGWSAGESSVTMVVSSQVAQLRSTSSLQPIRRQYWLYMDQSQRSIVKLCTNQSAVLLLPVDHGGLAGHGAVEVDHGDSLLIGPDHARLHHLHSQSQVSIVSFNQSEPSITCPDTSSSNTKADTFSSSSGWILAK